MDELECLTGLFHLCLHWRRKGSRDTVSLGWVWLELDSFPSHHHCSSVAGLRQGEDTAVLQLLLLSTAENSIFNSSIFVSLAFRDLFSVVSLDYLVHSCWSPSQSWGPGSSDQLRARPGCSEPAARARTGSSLCVWTQGRHYRWSFRNGYCRLSKALLTFALFGLSRCV